MVSPDPSGIPRAMHKPSSGSWAACPTHIEVVSGDAAQLLVDGMQPLQQDGVSTFAVQPDLALRAADCREEGIRCSEVQEQDPL